MQHILWFFQLARMWPNNLFAYEDANDAPVIGEEWGQFLSILYAGLDIDIDEMRENDK